MTGGALSRLMTVDDWDVVLTDGASGHTVVLHPDQPDRFWADPFLLVDSQGSGHPTLLCEEFDHRTNLGTVVEIGLGRDLQVVHVAPMLGTGHHESYPFTFEFDGARYCIPETAELGSVFLYKRHRSGWLRETTLLDGFPGLDATLVVDPVGDLWLFASPLTRPDDLHLWHATDLTGPWRPHRLNPVVSSTRGGRSAGRIRREGERLVRPGQNSAERYGGSIVEFEIEELTTDRYREREVGELRPSAGYVGTHTVDRVGSLTVVDAVRRTPIISNRSFVQWRLRKIVRQLARRQTP